MIDSHKQHRVDSLLERQWKKAKYALLAAKLSGLDYLVSEVKQRTYRKETFIGLQKDLNEPDVNVKAKINFLLELARDQDIEEMIKLAHDEGREATFDLVQRKWFFESGFRNCYVARTAETGEICHLQWAVTRQDDNSESEIFKSSFPRLREKEMQIEHIYTFKKYRGNKLMPAVMCRLFQIARHKGIQRVIIYVLEENSASIKGCYSAGLKNFEIVHRTKLPFSTRYKILVPETIQ